MSLVLRESIKIENRQGYNIYTGCLRAVGLAGGLPEAGQVDLVGPRGVYVHGVVVAARSGIHLKQDLRVY